MLSSINRTKFLRLEWALSLALIAIALTWAEVRDIPLGQPWAATSPEILAGVAAGSLLWVCIPLLHRSAAIRRLWDGVLVPFARGLRMIDLVVVALLSGISEELFFRGILLPELGLVTSSVVFGALHALTPLYALWAGLTGAGFALLTTHGSLGTAMIAHATYNAGALLALRHWQPRTTAPRTGASDGPANSPRGSTPVRPQDA